MLETSNIHAQHKSLVNVLGTNKLQARQLEICSTLARGFGLVLNWGSMVLE